MFETKPVICSYMISCSLFCHLSSQQMRLLSLLISSFPFCAFNSPSHLSSFLNFSPPVLYVIIFIIIIIIDFYMMRCNFILDFTRVLPLLYILLLLSSYYYRYQDCIIQYLFQWVSFLTIVILIMKMEILFTVIIIIIISFMILS